MSFSIKRIRHETPSVGQRLRRARLRQRLPLEKVELETTIRAKYLEALERDDFDGLPAPVYSLGFLRRYGEYLGLNAKIEPLLHDFKTALALWRSQQSGGFSPLKTVEEPKLFITPKLVGAVTGALALIFLMSYIWYQVRFVTTPPLLVINTPVRDLTTDQARVAVSGKTQAGVALWINDESVPQDDQGNFNQEVALRDGINTIAVIAQNRFDKQTVRVLQVLKTGPNSLN